MSKEFSSDCKHSQNKLSFTSPLYAFVSDANGRMPLVSPGTNSVNTFQPSSSHSQPSQPCPFPIPIRIISSPSPFPRVLRFSKHSSCTSLLSTNGFPRTHTTYFVIKLPNLPFFWQETSHKHIQDKCWCPFRAADDDWGNAESHMKSELLEMAQAWGF